MRYIDTGTRDPIQALGNWFNEIVNAGELAGVRWQSGFFTADGLGILASAIERLREEGGVVNAVVGSNDGDTLRSDVDALVRLIGIPRAGAKLGIVSYAGAFYHPKTYHFTRRDGTQAAYVGSANLTLAGVASLHIEAGVLLDTRDGDHHEVLDCIRAGVDAWFSVTDRPGISIVDSLEMVDRLAIDGVLAEQPTYRARNHRGEEGAGEIARRPGLRALVRVPQWRTTGSPSAPERDAAIQNADEEEEDLPDEVPSDSSVIAWDLVWRSNGLSERDLNIPSGTNTNRTGSIGLKKGDWDGVDHRHYFREDVFAALPWSRDARQQTREVATAVFEVWINGSLAGETALTISHNTNVSSRTYEQKNEMTHLRWGEARAWVAQRRLLGSVLTLYRERNPLGVPKFRVSIDDQR